MIVCVYGVPPYLHFLFKKTARKIRTRFEAKKMPENSLRISVFFSTELEKSRVIWFDSLATYIFHTFHNTANILKCIRKIGMQHIRIQSQFCSDQI